MDDVPHPAYERLPDALEGFSPGRLLALPDGSVDVTVRVRDAGSRITDAAAFGRRVADGEAAFQLDPRGREPGGQAVNMALQAHALGAAVRCYCHCDDPAFDLPFPTTSLGKPGRVTVCEFDDDALMLAEGSADLAACDADDLRAAGAFEEPADAVCVGNYASVPGVAEILTAVADAGGDGPVVLDPGPVVGIDGPRVERLRDALSEVAAERRVVVSANEPETRALADALATDVDDTPFDPAPVRETLDVDAVVVHETEHALAVTGGSTVRVPNLTVEETVANTGGGDRFSAALAGALAADWEWAPALALANACASYHVATGETADREGLESFL